MTNLEIAARELLRVLESEKQIDNFRTEIGRYTMSHQKPLLMLLDAIEEIDNQKPRPGCLLRGCLDLPENGSSVCARHRPTVEVGFAKFPPTLTGPQRRMGLRSTRHISGPEYNSDVD